MESVRKKESFLGVVRKRKILKNQDQKVQAKDWSHKAHRRIEKLLGKERLNRGEKKASFPRPKEKGELKLRRRK